jgi:Mn-dependent DtxR family transcriptional regulator
MPEHHSDEEYLEAIRSGNHGTTAIAEAVGVKRQSAHERLKSLEGAGKVDHETVGNSFRWIVADDE